MCKTDKKMELGHRINQKIVRKSTILLSLLGNNSQT